MSTRTPSALTPGADTFDRDVLESSLPVLVDFWAPWCGPCRAMKPHVEALIDEMEGRLRVAFVNVDEEPELASRFGIQSIPALRLFKGGRLVDGHNGLLPPDRLREFLEKAL